MVASAPLVAARAALAAGEWSQARAGFDDALAVRRTADALDGLGRALWWLKAPDAALELRTQAYAAFRLEGRTPDAVRTAVWLAREYRSLYRSDAVADGWLARARTLAEADVDHRCLGWVLLAESDTAESTTDALALVAGAVAASRREADPDLEIAALSRRGVLEVTMGDVPAGSTHIDEAMAAATAGEARDPQYVGEAFCALIEVATLLGDMHAVNQWASVLSEFRERYDYAPLAAYGGTTASSLLSSYCGSCCGAVYLVTGRIDEAEQELAGTVD
ncbi:MAG: DNA-binding response regulator, partial [Nocardioidaceae bacterium]